MSEESAGSWHAVARTSMMSFAGNLRRSIELRSIMSMSRQESQSSHCRWGSNDEEEANRHLPNTPDGLYIDPSGNRWRVGRLIYSPQGELFIGAILMFNFFVIILDSDARASGREPPSWAGVASDFCFAIYVIEFACRVFVERTHVFRSQWNRLDCTVLVAGLGEKAFSSILPPDAGSSFMMLRVVRILRLVRAIKLLGSLRELRKLIQMLMLCVRTLFWSCLLTFFLMTMWAVIMVEIIHPLVKGMEDELGVWGGDTDWTLCFSSVMRANLTLFQTIIAGDSWGTVPVPIINKHPWTALFFIPAQVTLAIGVLNLIVAVLVDTVAEVRENDLKARIADMELNEKDEKQALNKIFQTIDTNGDGLISFDELTAGVQNTPDLSARLRVMDVRKEDLQQLFAIVDEDGSGDLDAQEFGDVLYRLKYTQAQAASITILKHFVLDISRHQKIVADTLVKELRDLKEKVSPGNHGISQLSKSRSHPGQPADSILTNSLETGSPNSPASSVSMTSTAYGKTAASGIGDSKFATSIASIIPADAKIVGSGIDRIGRFDRAVSPQEGHNGTAAEIAARGFPISPRAGSTWQDSDGGPPAARGLPFRLVSLSEDHVPELPPTTHWPATKLGVTL